MVLEPLTNLRLPAVQLAPIVFAGEVTLRLSDEAIGANAPLLKPADANRTTCTSWPSVRPHKSPAVYGLVSLHDEVVHEHLQVGK